MCRYAFTKYKPRRACFACRKAFRRRLKADVDPGGEDHIPLCPQCAQPMADLGLDFWPPPTSACKKWAAVASLWRTGTTFHSCGCRGPGWRPATRPALLAFLQQQRIAAVAQLEGWRTNDSPERTLAMARFGLQVERIDRELALISRPGRKTKDRASRGGST